MKDKLTNYKPQTRNANKHTPRGMGVLEKSIQADGWIGAITVAADGETFDGSARIEVGVATGFEDAIVVESDGTRPIIHRRIDIATADDPRARRLGIAANRVAQLNLDFDIDELLASVADGVDLSAMFRQDELDALLQAAHGQDEKATGEDKGAQTDRAAELKEQWGTKLGQVWQLGEHRIAVGDCTDRATVEAVMRGERAELLFTSPPYADIRDYKGGDLSVETLAGFIPVWASICDYLCVNLGIKRSDNEIVEYWDVYKLAAKEAGLKLLSWNVWDKQHAGSVSNQTAMFAIEHEWIFVFGKAPKDLNRTIPKSPDSKGKLAYNRKDDQGRLVRDVRQRDGSMSPSTVGNDYTFKNLSTVARVHLEMDRTFTKMHPAIFPVALPSEYIEAVTGNGGIVAEPFSGSGTTLIACEKLNRKARCVELDEGYAAVSIHRWYEMTGKEPRIIT